MKELFESAELEVMILSNDDIIRTSTGNDPASGGQGLPGAEDGSGDDL